MILLIQLIFSGFEADELIVLDIDASPMKRTISYKFVEALATFTKVPLCVGGGIRCLDQIQKLISLGVEKVALSSSLDNDFDLLEKASNRFGSSSITVIIIVLKIRIIYTKETLEYPKKIILKKILKIGTKMSGLRSRRIDHK